MWRNILRTLLIIVLLVPVACVGVAQSNLDSPLTKPLVPNQKNVDKKESQKEARTILNVRDVLTKKDSSSTVTLVEGSESVSSDNGTVIQWYPIKVVLQLICFDKDGVGECKIVHMEQ